VTSEPLVTIGVTTYDRPALLRESLNSIVQQTVDTFEVIVGNDNPVQVISESVVGLNDDRFRFVNHPVNLGELPNMNFLLDAARGRYFTWLADDDVYAPNYLSEMLKSIRLTSGDVAFCGYVQGNSPTGLMCSDRGDTRIYSGSDFVTAYLEARIQTLGVYGLFELEYLKRVGGMRRLGSSFSPYSDNLLVLESGKLPEVAFCDAALVFFRTHSDSVSYSSQDLSAFATAQADLADRCREIFGDGRHRGPHMTLLLRWFVRDFSGLLFRCQPVSPRDVVEFAVFVFRRAREASLTLRIGLLIYSLRKFSRAALRFAIGR
jgi:glycosyltransferase involved in cell wall biosynthesis